MAYADGAIPRGLSDLKVWTLDSSDVPDDPGIDVPGIRALNFNVESDSDELEGDNVVIAVARDAKRVTGSIELGIMNLTALGTMTGGTPTTTGVTPNVVTTLLEAAEAPSQYIAIMGQAPDRRTSGSAYRVTILKALVTSGPDESLTVNEWSTPTLDFEATEDPSGDLVRRQHYETEIAISTTYA